MEVDIQVLSATNRNLEEAVDSDQIRKDLYFRLKSVQIYLPPLEGPPRRHTFAGQSFPEVVSPARAHPYRQSESAGDGLSFELWLAWQCARVKRRDRKGDYLRQL